MSDEDRVVCRIGVCRSFTVVDLAPFAVARGKVEEHLQDGYRYALALTHQHRAAEDLVLRACSSIYTESGRVSCRSLLLSTVRREFFDQGRTADRNSCNSVEDHEDVTGLAAESGRSDQESGCLKLFDILAGMRVEEREALFLHDVLGHTVQEMVELTGQPANAVLGHLLQASNKLESL